MTNTLSQICADKLAEIAERKAAMPLAELEEKAWFQQAPRGFAESLRLKLEAGKFALIAELKKASPSKGLIREDFSPTNLARAYEQGGAACLSVLTDEKYFMGRDEYLTQAREAASLPVLRKDFMLDPYQITESRALGADAVLLIMAALSDAQARELEATAISLGLDVLAETHDREEMERALKLKTPLIGINNRNLKTMEIDLAATESLAPLIPPERIGICESGIFTHADLQRIKRSGVNAFLVGESLVREKDVASATRKLLGGE